MHDIKNITITPEILKLIAEIDEFKGRWKAIVTLATEKQLSGLRSESFASRGEQEVAGYAYAMEMIFDGYEASFLPPDSGAGGKTRGKITVKEIEDSTDANPNTIKVHVQRLSEQHYLTPIGKNRGALHNQVAGKAATRSF